MLLTLVLTVLADFLSSVITTEIVYSFTLQWQFISSGGKVEGFSFDLALKFEKQTKKAVSIVYDTTWLICVTSLFQKL